MENNFNENQYSPLDTTYIKRRSLLLAVILTIITFGIYGLYWFVKVTDEINIINNEKDTSGILSLVFTIITFGIYSLYWAYKMGKKYDKIKGNTNSYMCIVFLLLSLFELDIIVLLIIQDTINLKTYDYEIA